MRRILALAVLLMVVCCSASLGGIPDPSRSGCEATGTGSLTCHYAFSFDPTTGDSLVVKVTVRDSFDSPVASCSTSATLKGNSGLLCACEGLRLTDFTNDSGVVSFKWDCIGGCGNLDVTVTAHCTGNIGICSENLDYASTDLDASCDPDNATGVVDLGAWASGLPPSYNPCSDYDCDGTVGVIDLGFWASGLGKGCNMCP